MAKELINAKEGTEEEVYIHNSNKSNNTSNNRMDGYRSITIGEGSVEGASQDSRTIQEGKQSVEERTKQREVEVSRTGRLYPRPTEGDCSIAKQIRR